MESSSRGGTCESEGTKVEIMIMIMMVIEIMNFADSIERDDIGCFMAPSSTSSTVCHGPLYPPVCSTLSRTDALRISDLPARLSSADCTAD